MAMKPMAQFLPAFAAARFFKQPGFHQAREKWCGS
jgi:hypothetical protein